MTTIKLKNGSGAPLASDLVQGEPALDLTNKRLYTEDSGGAVIEVGVNPTELNVTNNITVGGTVDGRDIATDGTKLDTVETNADVTDTANVTAAGALMDSELTSEASVKALDQGVATTDSPTFAGLGTTADVTFGDNDKAIFGAGSDLQIYHDGSNSFIGDFGTGDLFIRGSNELRFQVSDGVGGWQTAVYALDNNQVQLLYAGNTRLTTTSTGIDVTGSVVSDGLTVDGNGELKQTSSGGEVKPLRVTNSTTTTGSSASLVFNLSTVSSDNAKIEAKRTNSPISSDTELNFYQLSNGTMTLRQKIATNGDISFHNSAGTSQDLFWDASTSRLGLGTTSPSAPLSVKKASTGVADTVADFGNTAVANGLQVITSDGNLEWGFNALNSRSMVFQTNQTERMRIDSSGRLGLGTTSPSTALDIEGSTSGNLLKLYNNLNAADTETGILFKDRNVDSGGSNAARIYSQRDGANNRFNLVFETADSGTLNEALTIDSSGNVGIGTTSPQKLLDVSSNSAPTIRISNTRNDTSWNTDPVFGALEFYSADASGSGAGVRASIKAEAESQYGNATNMVFRVGDGPGAQQERMRIDSEGNVGIGTTSPGYLVDAQSSGDAAIRIQSTGTGSSDDSLLRLQIAGTTASNLIAFGDSGNTFAGSIRYVHQYDYMRFDTNASERMRIDSSGNVGIGTSSPSDIVQVKSTSNGDGLTLQRSSLTSGDYAQLGFLTTTNDAGTPNLWIRGHRGATFETSYMTFGTGASVGSERMRIDSSGNLLVGKSSDDATTEGSTIKPNGRINLVQSGSGTAYQVLFYRNGSSSAVGSISTTSTATAYNTSSDQRLKDNIVDAPSASDDIDAIQVRSFDWKADGSHQKYGVIAQELNTVAPDAVTGDADSDEMMGVDYSKLVPMLVKEIQSLRARVAQLEGAN